jgi:1-acyl-sn-glycerol-3-phosphate acyltransferase
VVLIIRSLLFYVGEVLITMVLFPLAILATPLPPKPRAWVVSLWARLVIPWLKITCNIRHIVTGLDNLPEVPGVMLVKHQSAWETVVLQTITPAQSWVIKRELLWIPIYGWGLWASRPIAIDRKSVRKSLGKVISDGKSKIANGRWVVIFPEGTRIPYGEQGTYSAGGAMLAIEAGHVPLVPIAHDAGKLWPKKTFIKQPGIINLAIGPPIDTVGKSAREATGEARGWIEATLESWQSSENQG